VVLYGSELKEDVISKKERKVIQKVAKKERNNMKIVSLEVVRILQRQE
jgi:hypothetical protein